MIQRFSHMWTNREGPLFQSVGAISQDMSNCRG
jgi:hypothetical protein